MEISNLDVDMFNSPVEIDFGASSNLAREISQDLILKNSSSSGAALAIGISNDPGFKIKINRCGSSLAAGASCKLTVSFSNRDLFDGSNYTALLNITSSAQILLKASVSGKPDPDSSGVAELEIELDSAFVPRNSSAYRTLTIQNIGTGTAKDINVVIPTGYKLRLNRCPDDLKPGASGYVQIVQSNYRDGSAAPAAVAVVSSSNTSENKSVDLSTGGRAAKDLVKIELAQAHAMVLDSSGDLYAYGRSPDGQLGNGTNSNLHSAPSKFAGKYLDFSVGLKNSCAISSTGAAYCWGENIGNIILGVASQTPNVLSPEPVVSSGVLNGKTLTKIAMGQGSACAIDSAGIAYCWGFSSFGRLGNNSATGNSHLPVMVSMPVGVQFTDIQVALHTCALDTVGDIYCWGVGSSGALGDGTFSHRSVPTKALSSVKFKSLALSGQSSCAVSVADQVYCWGQNTNGQLGSGDKLDKGSPNLISGLSNIKDVKLTDSAGCALSNLGSVSCWGATGGGSNGRGHQGRGTAAPESLIPQPISHADLTGRSYQLIGTGRTRQYMAIVSNNSLYSFGDVFLGVPSMDVDFEPILNP